MGPESRAYTPLIGHYLCSSYQDARRATVADRLCRLGPCSASASRQSLAMYAPCQFFVLLRRSAVSCAYPFTAEGADGFEFRSNAPGCREGAGRVMDTDVLQDVRRRLNRFLTKLVHADRLAAIVASHKSVARNISGRSVHTLRLHVIDERC